MEIYGRFAPIYFIREFLKNINAVLQHKVGETYAGVEDPS